VIYWIQLTDENLINSLTSMKVKRQMMRHGKNFSSKHQNSNLFFRMIDFFGQKWRGLSWSRSKWKMTNLCPSSNHGKTLIKKRDTIWLKIKDETIKSKAVTRPEREVSKINTVEVKTLPDIIWYPEQNF
jgi:hypothetical protein